MSRVTAFPRRRRHRPLTRLERGVIAAAVVVVLAILWPDWAETALNADLPPVPAPSEDRAERTDITGHARVVDGDGLVIEGRRIRLYGIDAFELRQTCGAYACGRASADALRDLVGGRPVVCAEMDRDRYGRIVAVCEAGGRDLGAAMVRQGHAVAYTRYSRRYAPEERAARRENKGAWPHGFTAPETWRQGVDPVERLS